MRKLVTIITITLSLGACSSWQTAWNNLTPTQQAAVFCAVAANGTAIGVALTSGGAQATAAKVQGASVVACNGATQIGQLVTPTASH